MPPRTPRTSGGPRRQEAETPRGQEERTELRSSAASRGSELSTAHYLDRATLASLPAEVSPTVPERWQHTFFRPGVGARTCSAPAPSNNGGEARIPFDDASEWETVASGLNSVAPSSAAPPVPVPPLQYHSPYNRAGSSLADNSSVGGLTIPDRPRPMLGRYPPLTPTPRGTSSSRSYAHPQGLPAHHPLNNVPNLPARPNNSSRNNIGAQTSIVGGEFVNSSSTLRGGRNHVLLPWGPSTESIPESSRWNRYRESDHNSTSRLVHPATAGAPSLRDTVPVSEWEDITAELGPAGPSNHWPLRQNQFRRNVQRAVERQSQGEAHLFTPEASQGRQNRQLRTMPTAPIPAEHPSRHMPYSINRPVRPSSPVSTVTLTPRPRRWSPMSVPATENLTTPPEPVHTVISRRYEDLDIDDGNLQTWSSPLGFQNIQFRPRTHRGNWLRNRRQTICSTRLLVVWATIATLVALALAIAMIIELT